MLCWFLLYNNMNQLQMYTCPLPRELPSRFPHPTPLGCHSVPDWDPCVPQREAVSSSFPLALRVTHGTVSMSVLLSQLTPPCPYPTVSTSLFSTSVSLFVPCRQVRLYHFSRFHIYMHYTIFIFLFLTYFTLYDRLQDNIPHYNALNFVPFYSRVIFHCVYEPNI